jgi:hypothetical protein
MVWLDRTGPFVDDDRLTEPDDYFEYCGLDVTESGLGEATRRIKAREAAWTLSFKGGRLDFTVSPLIVDHGLAEARLGKYNVENVWTARDLAESAINSGPAIASWRILVEVARERFSRLVLPDSLYQNPALAQEPFEATIRDRVLVLLSHLDSYMGGRGSGGAEGPRARYIIETFFVGDRALFSGESPTNQRKFINELTFPDPEDSNKTIFAHWHGKISHRFFRVHFEWPVNTEATKLKVVYIGPKITKE